MMCFFVISNSVMM